MTTCTRCALRKPLGCFPHATHVTDSRQWECASCLGLGDHLKHMSPARPFQARPLPVAPKVRELRNIARRERAAWVRRGSPEIPRFYVKTLEGEIAHRRGLKRYVRMAS